jgi:hypothetical protein
MPVTTPLTLEHPHVRAFLDVGDWEPFADWLQDQDATPAAVAVRFAGTPPGHLDGPPQEWLARWLMLAGREGDAGAVRGCVLEQYEGRGLRQLWHPSNPTPPSADRLVYVLANDVDATFPTPISSLRAASLIGLAEDCVRRGGFSDPREGFHAAVQGEYARARRDLKRRVLSLPCWEGLWWGRQIAVDTADGPPSFCTDCVIAKAFGQGKLRPDLPWSRHRGEGGLTRLRQRLKAADLVQLDTGPTGGVDLHQRVMSNEVVEFADAVNATRRQILNSLVLPAQMVSRSDALVAWGVGPAEITDGEATPPL